MAPTRSTGIFLCLLIIVMDVAAGILGIEAEIAQNKVQHLKLWLFECRDPSQKAFQMGLAAAILLGLAHAIVCLMGGLSCLCSQQGINRASSNKQISMLCLVLAWIALAVGMILLVIGTKSNHGSNGSCGFSHHHFLSIGGISCFVHGLFSVLYYGSATATFN
ncbi:protein VASCULATURE COMPLEXITY AND CONNECTIVITY-like [Arachis stenosperma]|uniref:protein VASCULATURE COMPLEXITY AND CONNECTIVITY-like n=1 Tax=Arachis stenosperma TaxID=217475 RepID=UPI0025AB6D9D|nr:protein VASCULATURE COMPLEXITY AND CONNECTIVITY-like [Arachis stenosperma]